MGIIKQKEKVQLIIGILSADKLIIEKAVQRLSEQYGLLDYESEFIDFIFTDYYETEMGKNLLRKFISFKKLINPEILPDIKIFTNKLEEKFLTTEGKRLINLDPGYITLGKLVLATTKNQQHRIYLRNGIFAEVTLRYTNKTFTNWEWTYPDYRTKKYVDIFNHIRELYKESCPE